MKRILALAATAAALTLALSGCGSANSGSTLDQVKEEGVLIVGTEGTYRPFSYHDGGKLTGYDVEVITAVADELGVDVKFEETQWDGIFAGLTSGRFDAIANQVSIDPKREAEYLFSTPYTVSNGVIVTSADNDEIDSFESLKGKTTAQSLTSNWYKIAKDAGAKVEPIEGWAQAVTLLKQGRVDATVNDKLTYLDAQKTDPDDSIKIAAESEENSRMAVAFRKDSEELRDAVDEALATLAEDGTLTELSQKYFGEDVTK